MDKTSLTLALAIAAATLLTTAPAQAQVVPNYGAYAKAYGGSRSGGEGSFSAMSNTLAGHKWDYGWAMAGLSDGTLHAAASAVIPSCAPSCATKSYSSSMARYWDTVTFVNGQNLGLAKLSVSIDGTLSGMGANASVRWYAGSRPADFFERLSHHAPAIALESGTTVLGDELAIPLGRREIFIFAELYTEASSQYIDGGGGWNASADFGNTLHFNWTLPEGVTVSSASGQFMTTAVPEPTSALMLVAGLAGIGGLRLRRRGAAQ